MFDLSIKENEKKWLRANYPTLKINKDRSGYTKVTGLLKFDMVLYPDDGSYVIKPNPKHLTQGQRIQDEYQIEIIFKNSEHSDLPQVYEKGGRIASVAANQRRKLEDLHINQGLNGVACLCANIEEANWLPNGFNLQDFFNNLVIPFFYGQHYFEKNGVWPWKEFSHGLVGLLESYLKQENITKEKIEEFLSRLRKRQDWQSFQICLSSQKKIKGHHICLCGRPEKFRNCHNDALHGLWKLKEDIIKFCVKI